MAQGSPTSVERLALCRLAFEEIPGAEVSDLEISREGRSYSADTVELLRRQYPEDTFYLVVGSDMFLSFCTWYKFQYLLENCVLTVLSREEDDLLGLERFQQELEEKYGAKVLLLELLNQVPVFLLECRPDLGAVEAAEQAIFPERSV